MYSEETGSLVSGYTLEDTAMKQAVIVKILVSID